MFLQCDISFTNLLVSLNVLEFRHAIRIWGFNKRYYIYFLLVPIVFFRERVRLSTFGYISTHFRKGGRIRREYISWIIVLENVDNRIMKIISNNNQAFYHAGEDIRLHFSSSESVC